MRIHDNRIPKEIFCSELVAGKRRPGGRIKRYKENFKRVLRLCSIPPSNWTEIADDPSQTVNCSEFGRACVSDFVLSVHRRERKH